MSCRAPRSPHLLLMGSRNPCCHPHHPPLHSTREVATRLKARARETRPTRFPTPQNKHSLCQIFFLVQKNIVNVTKELFFRFTPDFVADLENFIYVKTDSVTLIEDTIDEVG